MGFTSWARLELFSQWIAWTPLYPLGSQGTAWTPLGFGAISNMTEPKGIDMKSIDNLLKSSLDKPQWGSDIKAIANFVTKVDAIHAAQSRRNK